MMKYICVDVGSSYIKTALLDTKKWSITLFPAQHLVSPDRMQSALRCEVDANEIYNQFKACIDSVLCTISDSIGGILLSTQMHGFVFARKDAIPLTPYISWQDTRCLLPFGTSGKTYLDYLTEAIPSEMMRYAGVALKPGLGMCNAYTLLDEKHYDIPKDSLFFTIGSYLIYRLTGQHICHLTNAAPTGFANIQTGGWNDALIKLLGFDSFVFPEIITETQAGGMYQGIPVFPDLGDQQCCVLGGLLHWESDVNVNIGTSAQISYITSRFISGKFETRPFFEGHYLPTITRLPGGRNLQVMMRFFQDIAQSILQQPVADDLVWQAMSQSIANACESELTVSSGFFKGMLGDAGGNICNIAHHNFTFSNLNYALYEGIANEYEHYMHDLVGEHLRPNRLVFTGGVACKDAHMLTAISKAVGIPGVLPPYRCEVFVGMYHLALILDRMANSFESARNVLDQTTLRIVC